MAKNWIAAGIKSTPAVRIADSPGYYAELPAEFFYEELGPFDLAISWACGFAVGYDANADCLLSSMPGICNGGGPLPLPLFRRLYLAVISPAAVVQTEMAVDIFGTGKALM